MKVLRFFCNILLLIAITIGISVIQIGVYDLTASQSSAVDAIHIIDYDNETSYLNSYGFWANDISTNFKAEPRYRVRNWSKNATWKKTVGKWADYAIDAVIGVIKPIVVPIASVNGMKNYYGMAINVQDILNGYASDYRSANDINNALYELYVIYGKGYGNAYQVVAAGERFTTDSTLSIYDYEYDTAKKAIISDEISSVGKEVSFARWVRDNKTLYKENWKLIKYNSGKYERYAKKFLRMNYAYDENGEIRLNELGLKVEISERTISPAVLVLYYQQYVSLIIAIIFVIKYPVNFVQLRVSGRTGRKKKGDSNNILSA